VSGNAFDGLAAILLLFIQDKSMLTLLAELIGQAELSKKFHRANVCEIHLGPSNSGMKSV
jgi:hypothetical protein